MMIMVCVGFVGGAAIIGWLGGRNNRLSITILGSLLFRAFPMIIFWIFYTQNYINAYTGVFNEIAIFGDICLSLFTVLIAGVAHGITRAWAIYKRIPPGHCQQCGYNLFANISGICPECGTPIPKEVLEKLTCDQFAKQ